MAGCMQKIDPLLASRRFIKLPTCEPAMKFSRPATAAAAAAFVLCVACAPHAASAKPPESGDMQYGPVACHSVTFVKPANKNADTWDGAVTRAINVAVPGEATVCYDADRLAVASVWRGGFLDTSNTHHTSYKGGLCPRPGAQPQYTELYQPGWATPSGALAPEQIHFGGYYLHGEQAVLAYEVAGRDVLELPIAQGKALGRNLSIGGGKTAVSLLVGKVEKSSPKIDGLKATALNGSQALAATLSGETGGLKWRSDEGSLYLDVPPADNPRSFVVWYHAGDAKELPEFWAALDVMPKPVDPAAFTKGGPRRWTETIITTGRLGEEKGAYMVDDLVVPVRPYGSWMRLSSLDFFDDGRLAVATMPGDVWIVSWEGDDISELSWQRFATGLYEPLGLKVVDGEIYIRGRDRLTRLHDLNDDGEADYYENFHSQGPIGPGYHAFVFDLNTDDEGNFYYVISGRKCPSIGEVIKLSPDGKTRETIATHFRHPNGMGYGGPHGWLTIADNPGGKFPSGASIVRPGRSYGEEGGPRTEPFLYLLPPKVDTSSGSQCWADPKRWGPLSGTLVHTSYSTSSITYVIPHDSKPYPSGYAVHMPFGFKAGVMRLRVSPRDGQIYIAGQRGWDSNAATDGCLHRVRYTGNDAYLVTGAKAIREGVQITFSCPLDKATAIYDNFFAARVGDKKEQEVDIDDVEMVDERTVLVLFDPEDIDPAQVVDRERTKRDKEGRTHFRVVPPLAITFNMKAKDGAAVKDTLYCTINGF